MTDEKQLDEAMATIEEFARDAETGPLVHHHSSATGAHIEMLRAWGSRMIATIREQRETIEARDAEIARLRGALERIVGMCDVPNNCPRCGRPSGIAAVSHCAAAALRPAGEEAPDA